MEAFSVKGVIGNGNCFFRGVAVLLETVSFYFVLKYHIADAGTVLCCAEYSH
jgi:hypothetical protein